MSIVVSKIFNKRIVYSIEALSGLDIPYSNYNWLMEYLKDRRHFTSFELSKRRSERWPRYIVSASIVQGSVVGPRVHHRDSGSAVGLIPERAPEICRWFL